MDSELLADRFRQFRESSGYTQKQLAKLIGKSHITVQSYEKGTSSPNADTIWKMCETYKVDPNTLLGWYIDHPQEAVQHMDPEHAELVGYYDQCTDDRRDSLMRQARDAAFMSRGFPERDLDEATTA